MLFMRLVADNQQLWDKCKVHYMWAKQMTNTELEKFISNTTIKINEKSKYKKDQLEFQVGNSAFNFFCKHQVLKCQYKESEYHHLNIVFAKSLATLINEFSILTKVQIPSVLTIAGHDPSGGAGISADLKTMTSHKVYGASVITALTIQNTLGVKDSMAVDANYVKEQLANVLTDINFDCIKIGMLANGEIVKVVASQLTCFSGKVILDPVICSSGGHQLLSEDAINLLKELLLPLTYLVTPNIPEAELLLNQKIKTINDMEDACIEIHKFGVDVVLLKGGHLNCEKLTDVLYYEDKFYTFTHKKINTKNTHGTGCTLASAIASNIAIGYNLPLAIELAIEFVNRAIKQNFKIGHGNGPINHVH